MQQKNNKQKKKTELRSQEGKNRRKERPLVKLLRTKNWTKCGARS
jgi:hypothetical protein